MGSARVAPAIVATAVAVIAILLSAVRIVSSNFLQKIIALVESMTLPDGGSVELRGTGTDLSEAR